MSENTSENDVAVGLEDPAVIPKQKKKDKTKDHRRTKKQPPYVVIVENDEYHTFPYVTEVLQRICGHNLSRAYELTCQVHFGGRAAVWTGSLEVAELKRDQIRGYGPDIYARTTVKFPLGATIEPLPSE